jgi:hypothetical protein
VIAADTSPYWIALIGAGSAILGALLSSLPGYLVARRSRQREEERDRRALRQVGRLVLEELGAIAHTIDRTALSGRIWPADRGLPAFAWAEHRAALAAALKPEAWRWVAAAYSQADDANWEAQRLRNEAAGNHFSYIGRAGPVDFVDNDWLRRAHHSVRTAQELLERELADVLDAKEGIYTYTGRVSTKEIEELWPTRARPDES